MSPGNQEADVDPWWTWPSRLLGVALIVGGLLGPLWWLYQRSVAAVPRERWVETAPLATTNLRPKMLQLPTGDFMMGSKAYNEQPVHQVEILRAFAMSETEVTQEQYQAVMGDNPSKFRDKTDSAQRPVELVSWLDAVKYCNKLSEKEGRAQCYQIQDDDVRWNDPSCPGYRLPTEAEWEYAARADQDFEYAGAKELDRVAWYKDNAGGETHAVRTKQANGWFLHDLSGNVWEWVWDWYGDTYHVASRVNPSGPAKDHSRVLRGGAWPNKAVFTRVSARDGYAPSYLDSNIGFRLARSTP